MTDSIFALAVTLSLFAATLLWVPFLHLRRRHLRRTLALLGMGLLALTVCGTACGQFTVLNTITTVAGNGTGGFSGDGGQATAASLNNPKAVAVDKAGNLYFSDTSNARVRKVSPNGIITTVAGNGTAGYSGDNGPATSATLNRPNGLALDAGGNLYIADVGNYRIRKVTPSGTITTFAGTGTASETGDNGPATGATLEPVLLAFDGSGNLYVGCNSEGPIYSLVRRISASGTITPFAGSVMNTSVGGDGGPATSAGLGYEVDGLAVDAAGNVYIADYGFNGGQVREVTIADGKINTVAGNGTFGFGGGDGGLAIDARVLPYGLACDAAGDLFINDGGNLIREVFASSKKITTVAGNGTMGYSGDGGLATSGEFVFNAGLALDTSGNIYIADEAGARIRAVGPIFFPPTPVGATAAPQNYFLQTTAGEAIRLFYVITSLGSKQEYTIGKVTGCTVDLGTVNPVGSICQVPVTFSPAYPGRRPVTLQVPTSTGFPSFPLNGFASAPLATLTPGIISTLSKDVVPSVATGVAVDNAGDLYFVDSSSGNLDQINSAGQEYVITQFSSPSGVSEDGDNNLYVGLPGELMKEYIFLIYPTTTATMGPYQAATPSSPAPIAGTGTFGYSGDGGPALAAKLGNIVSTAVDPGGNVYLADILNNVVRKVSATTGIITTVAGNGTQGSSGDNGPATSASLNLPAGIAVDSSYNVYITENGRIRKVDPNTGIITTFAGNGTGNSPTDGVAATSTSEFSNLPVAFDAAGNVYLASSNAIRKVEAATGLISTVAGSLTASPGSSGDGGPATSATINPEAFAVDSAGNLLILNADSGGVSLRKVDVSGSALVYPTTTAVGSLDNTDDPQTFVLNNIGNTTLTGLAGNGAITASWLLDASATCSIPFSSVAPGASCTVPVDFKPTVTGSPLTGTVTLLDDSLNALSSTQTVKLTGTAFIPPDFTITATPATQTSYLGTTVTYQLAIAPVAATNPFTNAINLSASGLPTGATVSFAPPSVTPGAATVSVVMTVTIPALQARNNEAPPRGRNSAPAVLSATLLLALALTGNRRIRRKLRITHALVLLVFAGGLCLPITGCSPGNGTGFTIPQSTSTITITGTSGTLAHSATVSLTVK